MANSISSSSSNTIPSSKTTINDLPQHILIHILSLLYLPEAIQTSRISRSFRNLWHFLPSLNFDIFEFYSRSTSPIPRCNHSRNLFVDFVSQTLNFRQPNPLTKFHLTFEYTNWHEHKYNVQSWILYAINLSVSELVIDFGKEGRFYKWKDPDDDDSNRLCKFDFYLSDIVESHIKVMKLYKCKPMFPPETSPIKFVSLKSITLAESLYINVEDISNLVARCVNLEILTLARLCFNTKEGLVIHSSTLKELYLFRCSNCAGDRLGLDICCPCLQKISFVSSQLGKVINKDTTRLVKACIDVKSIFTKDTYKEIWERMLSYFTNISSLQAWHELLESNEVPAGCERFASNVKHLELYGSYDEDDLVGLAALLKLMPKLEILGLENGCGRDENLQRDYRKASTVFNMPCLKKVIMRKYHNTKRERHFIKLFKKNGIVLDKIELLPPSNEIEYYNY